MYFGIKKNLAVVAKSEVADQPQHQRECDWPWTAIFVMAH